MKATTRTLAFCLAAALVPLIGGCDRKPAPPAAITDSAVSADGIAIKYDVIGHGHTALLFVHCWTCNRGFWDQQVAHFAPRYRVVRLDLAGHGDSGGGRTDYTTQAFGTDVAAVVEKLGLKNVVLIGHSMGGPVAVEAERRLNGRVIGVVGVDTFYTGFPVPKNDQEAAAFVKPFEDDFKGSGEKFMRSMFTPQSDRALIDRIGNMVVGADQTMAVSALKNTIVWYRKDAAAALERLGDRLRNVNADPKGENKPLHRSVTLIAGVGHFVAQEKPVEFNRALDGIVGEFSGTTKRAGAATTR
jgi:pimeloyl-ACP methyl ester carboxylesterase